MANTAGLTVTDAAWQKATPLDSAWLLVASATERQRYNELLKLGGGYAFLSQPKDNMPKSLSELVQSESFKQGAEFNQLIDALKKRLLKLLQAGIFLGYGYAQPRGAADKPCLIDTDTWKAQYTLPKEIVTHAGLTYLGIRILSKEPAQEIVTAPIGRPSIAPYILKAFDALEAAGIIDPTKSLKAHVTVISKWVTEKHPDAMSGKTVIDYTTIQKAVGARFNLKKHK